MWKGIVLALGMVLTSTGASAHYKHHHYHVRYHHYHYRRHRPEYGFGGGSQASEARRRGLAWCGAFMDDVFHFTGALARKLWIAANWAFEGRRTEPKVGAVVVYRHHVAKIVGGGPGHWIMLSGNDGHRVRERARSLRGAIAIRWI